MHTSVAAEHDRVSALDHATATKPASTRTRRQIDVRGAIWTRVGWHDAERLALEIGERPRSIEERLARARCWAILELYEPAWSELSTLEREVPASRLRARIRADLLILSYYLARQLDEAAFANAVEAEAESERGTLADLHLGLALRATARNDLHEAIRQVHFGLDIAKLAQEQQPRELLPLLRVQAHVLAQAACYQDAVRAAELALALSRPIGDTWEFGRSVYSKGFVLWCEGRPREAIVDFNDALALTQAAASSLPRWIRCSRARAFAMVGRLDEAEMDLAASSHHLPEDVAYLAIVRGEPEVAETVLEPHLSGGDPFVLSLFGISQSLLGLSRQGEEHLAAAEAAFAVGGLRHYALAAQIHLGFCRDQRRHGAGRARARVAATDLASRGARGFAWPHPAIASWFGRVIAAEPQLAGFAASAPAEAEQPVPVAARLREVGLTPREAEIAVRVGAQAGDPSAPTRKTLAAELGISPNTLRVHMMRIRDKLELVARGDSALEAALENCLQQSHQTRLARSGPARGR